MKKLILDYKREQFNLVPGTGDWKLRDAETGKIVLSAPGPNEAVTKAQVVFGFCSVDYSESALNKMREMTGGA